MSKFSKKLSVLIATLAAAALLIPSGVSALSGSEFQAGRIMDDSVFFNPASMNVQQIQEFLNAKVPNCDTNGTQMYGSTGMTRAEWAAANGKPTPPYICLKNFRQDTLAKSAENSLCSGYGVANQSAAEIIYGVSQSCGVNPKVLIVLLQKEQSLVTDDWPWPVQYQKATGYGCPDTAPCDSQYYGFFNQVWSAARQFKRYARDSNLYNYRAFTTSFVQYNPNSGCGGSNVYMHNQATAGLYNYTPYQPNAAALNNLYGTGDGCSAYGNRNFWRMYNDWFGSTYAPNFSWQLTSQALYTDSTKSTGASSNILAGTKAYAVIKVKNTGNQTWTKNSTNTVRLGTIRPLERRSSFCDNTWLSCSRPAGMVENSVAPGATATFEFWLAAPNQGGQYNEYFAPVVEGVQWMPDIGLFYGMNVQPPTYTWQMTSQYAYTNESKTTIKNMNSLTPGEKIYVGFTAKNTGNQTWKNSGANAVMVGTANPLERQSKFSPGSDWLTSTRPALMKEASVAPGQTGTFEFWLTVPVTPGSGGIYNERFNIIANGITWFNDVGLSYYANVPNPTYTWKFIGQWAYTDSNRTIVANMNNLHPGDKVYARFTAQNTGNVTWLNNGPNAVMVGTVNPLDRISSFSPGSGWLSGSRPALMQNASIAPGATATFEFIMTAPATLGIYNERFGIIANGLTWFNDTGLSYYANVR